MSITFDFGGGVALVTLLIGIWLSGIWCGIRLGRTKQKDNSSQSGGGAWGG